MTAPVLRVDRLDVELGRPPVQILDSLSLDIYRGEVVGLIGETGSGKSTLAKAILGLVPPSNGTIHVGDVSVGALSRKTLRTYRRQGTTQYVFQDPLRSLDPDFTIGRSVTEGIRYRLPRSERLAILSSVADRVGLDEDLLRRRPAALSGGQRQRAAIARALAVEPRLLLCDEPVSALDASSRFEILNLLRTVATEESVATLLITHDLGSLLDIADRVAVLFNGRIVECRPTAELLDSPQHPYTQLLRASVPPLFGSALPAEERHALRRAAELESDTA